MNDSYTQISSADDVDTMIDSMAKQLLKDYPASPLFIVLLKGGAPFATKLMFALTRLSPEYHPELDYMLVSTYGQNRTASTPVIVADVAPSTVVDGRDIVILDDVIDQGITSDFVRKTLLSRDAESVRLAVLANKAVEGRTASADYIGIEAGDKWLIGMGLDDAKHGHEHYRWTDSISQVS